MAKFNLRICWRLLSALNPSRLLPSPLDPATRLLLKLADVRFKRDKAEVKLHMLDAEVEKMAAQLAHLTRGMHPGDWVQDYRSVVYQIVRFSYSRLSGVGVMLARRERDGTCSADTVMRPINELRLADPSAMEDFGAVSAPVSNASPRAATPRSDLQYKPHNMPSIPAPEARDAWL